jgi:hypothetical protein
MRSFSVVTLCFVCTICTFKGVFAQSRSTNSGFRLDTIVCTTIPFDFEIQYARVSDFEYPYVYVPLAEDSIGVLSIARFDIATFRCDTVYLTGSRAADDTTEIKVQELRVKGNAIAVLGDRQLTVFEQSLAKHTTRFSISLPKRCDHLEFINHHKMVVYSFEYSPLSPQCSIAHGYILGAETGSILDSFLFPVVDGSVFSILTPTRFLTVANEKIFFLDPLLGGIHEWKGSNEWRLVTEERNIDSISESVNSLVNGCDTSNRVTRMRNMADRLLELSNKAGSTWSEFLIADDNANLYVADRVGNSSSNYVYTWRKYGLSDFSYHLKGQIVDEGPMLHWPCTRYTYPFLGVPRGVKYSLGKMISVDIGAPMNVSYDEKKTIVELHNDVLSYLSANEPKVCITIFQVLN